MLIPSLVLVLAQAAGSQQAQEGARREQVMQWGLKGDTASCQSLEGALTDPSSDIRGRAASFIYFKCDRAKAGSRAVKQLCRSAELGNANAAVYLLLGYALRADAKACLVSTKKGWEMVKLVAASRPVPYTFATMIALARLGDAEGIADLRAAFAKNTPDEALFLLAAIGDVEDKAALDAAVKMLDDTREISGVKSGSKRHVRDAAADALTLRFRLKALPMAGHKYTAAEIAAVKAAIAQQQ